LDLLQLYILAPDITIEVFLVKRVQSFHRNDVYFPREGFAVDDLKSKVLILLGAMEFTQPYKVRPIELIDDRLYDVFLVNNCSLPENGNDRNEQGRDRGKPGNLRMEHDAHLVTTSGNDSTEIFQPLTSLARHSGLRLVLRP
jgi:hypothetical protein